MIWISYAVSSLLLILSGDVETNPGPKKGGAAPKDAGPTPEQKIAELESNLSNYEAKVQELEGQLSSQKEGYDKKLEELESKIGSVTAAVDQLKDGSMEQAFNSKLTEMSQELQQKLDSAEATVSDFKREFESFQTDTVQHQDRSGKQLEDIEGKIHNFKSNSEGQVQGVLSDAENLKGNYSSLEQRVKDIKIEATGKIQALASATKEQRKEYKAKFVDMDVEFGRMRDRLETLNLMLDDLQEKMYEFEQNKKNNLILYGVTAKHPENSDSLKIRITNIFRDHLNIRRDVPITRAARVHTGPEVRGCRPVLVTFETFKDRETVLRLAKVLKKANLIVTEDLSKRTRECRQELRKFMRQIKRANPEKACYLEYDKLYVDSKIFVYNEALGQVIEQSEAERFGSHGGPGDFLYNRPGTQMMHGYASSRPPSGMSISAGPGRYGDMLPKSASSIPRLPPLARAVSMNTGMSQIGDPRDEKMNEMERIITNYQEKLDAVETNYQEKVNILERKLVDKEDHLDNNHGDSMEDIHVDRDEDDVSPQATVHYDLPAEIQQQQQQTNNIIGDNSTLASLKQGVQKMIQPIMEAAEEDLNSNHAGVEEESNTSGDRWSRTMFEQFWVTLSNYEQLWTNLTKFEQIWVKFEQLWAILCNFEQFWANVSTRV